MLRPVVEPMLAQAREIVPGRELLVAGSAAELKYDGYRALIFTPARRGEPVLIQSRRGSMLQDRFPDLVAAAVNSCRRAWSSMANCSSGPMTSSRSRRCSAAPWPAPAPPVPSPSQLPAHFVAFDVLQADGQSLLTRSYSERRAVLESLFADHGLSAPWTLCPMTTDPAVAREWLEEWTQVPGLEGIVTKTLRPPTGREPGGGPSFVGGRPPKR